MDKTIENTARVLANLGSKDHGPSKGFQALIRQIGEAKTKHEEDRIIRKEAVILKERVGARDTTPRQMREYLIRLIYCEMLGHECSWGYIHAVKFTQSTGILDKRIGYLAVSLFLHDSHELIMLLVNTLQKDLKSSNMMEVSMALIMICKLIGAEMIPPLLPLVQDKLLHPKELVRKKAVLVMHHFYSISPDSVSHLEDDFRRALSDKDPGVMEAALILFHDLTKGNPSRFKDLASSFTSILNQVVTRKLPSEFDYHNVPAPWVQIRLLRILAILGLDDLKTSEQLYEVLQATLASSECSSNIGQAITYECIRTITTIYPNNLLIEKAAKAIMRFLTAPNNNWKYLGINALVSLVQVNPRYVEEHQMVVIDCLDDPDETLKRKTLDLLYKMTNPSNVTVITEKLLAYLRQTKDEFIRKDLVSKITQLAERYAPDNQWFIQTMNEVFELGGSLVRVEVAHNLMRLVAEGTEDEEMDRELRANAMASYVALLDKPHLPDALVSIICWEEHEEEEHEEHRKAAPRSIGGRLQSNVVGEYAYSLEEAEIELALEKITALLAWRFETSQTRSWVVTAMSKLVSQLGRMPDDTQTQLALYLTSTNVEIQQRCSEVLELSEDLVLMQAVLPLDASCEDLEVDSSLSFLDDFVSEALAAGAPSYRPAHMRSPVTLKHTAPQPAPEIKYKPYAPPAPPSHHLPPSLLAVPSSQDPSPAISPAPDLLTNPPSPAAMQRSRAVAGTETKSSARDSDSSVSRTAVPEKITVKERRWGPVGYKTSAPVMTDNASPSSTYSPHPSHSTSATEQTDSTAPAVGGGDVGTGEVKGSTPPTSREHRTAFSTVEATLHTATPEELAKQKLASDLFGFGVSGPMRAPKSRSPARSSAGRDVVGVGRLSRAPPQTLPPKSKEPEVDLLLGIDFSQPSVNPPAPNLMNSDPTGAGDGGLLDGLELRTPSSSFQAPTEETASYSSDLLGLFSSCSPSPSQAAPSSSAANAVLSPHLSSDLSLLEPSPASLQPALPDAKQHLAITMFENPIGTLRVPSEYSQLPVAPGWDNKEVCHDANLRVSLTKVLKLDSLVLVLFLTNQKQHKLTDISVMVNPPLNLKASTSDGSGDLTFVTDAMSGFGNATHVIILVPTSPAINMSVKGEISYKDSMSTQKRLFFDTTIHACDLMRPLNISTKEFGSEWGSLSHEKKVKVQCIMKPAEFMEAMKANLHFHPVELIGHEGITAGTFLPDTVCLVHGKVASSQVDFWVRSPSGLLTESVAKCASFIKLHD